MRLAEHVEVHLAGGGDGAPTFTQQLQTLRHKLAAERQPVVEAEYVVVGESL